jgi:hypothetical protein
MFNYPALLQCIHKAILSRYTVKMGHAVAQLDEALRYKPEGRGFDSRCIFEIFY